MQNGNENFKQVLAREAIRDLFDNHSIGIQISKPIQTTATPLVEIGNDNSQTALEI